MTEVLYPIAFPQDYAYFGMPKRKTSNLGMSSSSEDAHDYGILDERTLFKQSPESYLSTPRTSLSYHSGVYQDDSIHYSYSGVDTANIPAGYSSHSNGPVYMPSPEHSLHTFQDDYTMSPNSLSIGSVPMQQQLSHESIYYHTPAPSTDDGNSSVPPSTQGLSDSFNLNGALSSSSSSYSSYPQHDSETKTENPDLSMALHRSMPGNRGDKPKRQFTSAHEAVYTCHLDNCGKHFKRIWNFKAHQNTHDPDRPKPFQCSHPACGKSFVRKTDKERHETCVHSKKKEFKCHLCNSMFARKDTLRRHEDDGCAKRSGFPKSKPKKRRSPVIPNREPNPSPIKSCSSSRSSSRKSSFGSRPPMEAHLLMNRAYRIDLERSPSLHL
ncbi:hypothetical protein TWF788_000592 [Orbilia oligospora]|uniref:C2H2-type domain-containing protein n=1 Tax=Orbilia oligospora TaxID=2813651 RepID=A0A6G1MIM0_ORBOL|nr:hypothetical protein TWF788_000592 [Orbilia oligospora]KAF3207335.1 hypothetical protein TWF679_008402 [Orbilia oligospora]KAF3230416.1 hypothetical protein TWF191_010301 [Orbilia oligospora]KAF3260469.1 hypothetical protein TWF192_009749 [Orbilia oligospora]